VNISFATANLFMKPFPEVLELIAEAGFENIELDLYWERKEWAMAQHLKGVVVKDAVRFVEQAGLRITSIHDGGGVLENDHSITGYINPAMDHYLDTLGYAPECLVFHTPHIEGKHDENWWAVTSEQIAQALEPYRKTGASITIENCPRFDGYTVPLITPEELSAFTAQNGLGVTLDTTHYAQIDMDITQAARTIGPNLKTIHLSDYAQQRTHVFIGEGKLDWDSFFGALNRDNLQLITLECSLSSANQIQHEMSHSELVSRMREARQRLESWLKKAYEKEG
jgi:sugar phosphate isomerase/epimerase